MNHDALPTYKSLIPPMSTSLKSPSQGLPYQHAFLLMNMSQNPILCIRKQIHFAHKNIEFTPNTLEPKRQSQNVEKTFLTPHDQTPPEKGIMTPPQRSTHHTYKNSDTTCHQITHITNTFQKQLPKVILQINTFALKSTPSHTHTQSFHRSSSWTITILLYSTISLCLSLSLFRK